MVTTIQPLFRPPVRPIPLRSSTRWLPPFCDVEVGIIRLSPLPPSARCRLRPTRAGYGIPHAGYVVVEKDGRAGSDAGDRDAVQGHIRDGCAFDHAALLIYGGRLVFPAWRFPGGSSAPPSRRRWTLLSTGKRQGRSSSPPGRRKQLSRRLRRRRSHGVPA